MCTYNVVPCPNRCMLKLLRRDLPQHLQHDCAKRKLLCDHCAEEFTGEAHEVRAYRFPKTCVKLPFYLSYEQITNKSFLIIWGIGLVCEGFVWIDDVLMILGLFYLVSNSTFYFVCRFTDLLNSFCNKNAIKLLCVCLCIPALIKLLLKMTLLCDRDTRICVQRRVCTVRISVELVWCADCWPITVYLIVPNANSPANIVAKSSSTTPFRCVS